MPSISFVYLLFIIFTGTAILATLAMYTRQSLLVAYIFLGILLGPYGLKLVPDIAGARQIGDVGVIFLLFLIGLDLSPKDLIHTLRKTTFITVVSSLIFGFIGFFIGRFFGYNYIECLIIGAASMFSSTIIGIKLLPTKRLHHQSVGEWMISVLLLQDIIAIVILILINDVTLTGSRVMDAVLAMITLPALLGFAFFLQYFFLDPLFIRFEKVKEYVFLLTIGWCLGMAELAEVIGLPGEIGAFIAGVAIAEGPIAVYIAKSLRPLRDFFLVMFFFVVGASLDIRYVPQIWLPAILLAGILLFVKPFVFRILLQKSSVARPIATEIGFRLGQGSEFSILLGYLAVANVPQIISLRANYLIQMMILLTFIVSSYIVVLNYPTPSAFSEKLHRE